MDVAHYARAHSVFSGNGLDLRDILILQAAFLVAGALSLVRLHRNEVL